MVKSLPANAGDVRDSGSIPGSGRVPGIRNSSPLQYPFLENPTDREAWQDIVHGVTKSWTRLKQLSLRLKGERRLIRADIEISGLRVYTVLGSNLDH